MGRDFGVNEEIFKVAITFKSCEAWTGENLFNTLAVWVVGVGELVV